MKPLPQTKITSEDVSLIRAFYHSGVKQADIARGYGLSRSHISRIVRGLRRASGLATQAGQKVTMDVERKEQ